MSYVQKYVILKERERERERERTITIALYEKNIYNDMKHSFKTRHYIVLVGVSCRVASGHEKTRLD